MSKPGLPKKYAKMGFKKGWKAFKASKGKSSSKSSSKSKASKKGGKSTVANKRGFNTQKLFKVVRLVSLVGPALITIVGPGTAEQKGKVIMAKYTGISPDGSFRLNDLRQGYEPFFWTSLATYGIPKVVSFIKGLLS